VIGSIRRECLNHVVVLNEAGLRRVLMQYLSYYTRFRTHLALAKDSPVPRRSKDRPQVASSRHQKSAVCIITTSASPRSTPDLAPTDPFQSSRP